MRNTLCRLALAAGLCLVTASWASSTGRCGGTGGPHQKTLTCPSGQYVVGLQGRGGTYVDLVGIACAPIGADGKRGTVGAFKSAGSGGGTDSMSGTCSGNAAMIRIIGRSGNYYDRLIAGICSSRLATGRFRNPDDKATEWLTVSTGTGYATGNCNLDCPSGEALYSVTVKYGSWVDSVSGQCRP